MRPDQGLFEQSLARQMRFQVKETDRQEIRIRIIGKERFLNTDKRIKGSDCKERL